MRLIKPEDILRHELIGLKAKIVRSNNKQLEAIEGVIVDETQKTLVISGDKVRVIPKEVATFRLELPDGTIVDIEGKRLLRRPEDRLKLRVRRW